MLLGAASSSSSAIRAKQKIQWQILQFVVLTQAKPPLTANETFFAFVVASENFRSELIEIIE